ncbi:hypothetical protein HG535_0A04770 [Zygotorulaspora mrakii]|uniref:Signal recognition particle receptor subunit beta n=1 Tax=Zygotorulaspora mrakii TaxID=42260 RepID=A0A7H9AWL6_ZYGMR|nr:uncharacterized protein HG535_0A04770 [Zygotorulaspora mrakii]QLG70537.1 hypothetical protein HG535_0A04770 [Zygotorulaspora mrakii]
MLNNTVLIALVFVLITSSLLLITQRHKGSRLVLNGESITKNKEPTIIIAGPSNSGKTAFYTFLTSGKLTNTVTSQKTSVAHDFKLSKANTFRLMEFPGHNKLRKQLIDTLESSNNIKGLLFMVDSTTDPKDLTEVAEFLFQILQVTERQPDGCDILLACNKCESFTSRPPAKIKDALEKEMDKIIARKRKSLDSVQNTLNGSLKKTDDADNEDDQEEKSALLDIQVAGGFKFSSLEGNVDALEGSVTKNNVDKWECWIEERLIN